MNVGEDGIFEILLRLPVRSLLRFRSVSKCWRALIDTSLLKDTYLSLRRTSPADDVQVVGLKRQRHRHRQSAGASNENALITCFYSDYKSLAQSASVVSSIYDFEIPCSRKSLKIVNHVDGIVCLKGKRSLIDITLVNPALREIRDLPFFDLCGDGSVFYPHGFGFGYDEVSNDYKVVAIVSSKDKHLGLVYRLSTDSWTILGDVSMFVSEDQYISSDECVFSNGFIYWCVRFTDSCDVIRYRLLAFKMSNESFQLIPCPHGVRRYEVEPIFPRLLTVDRSSAIALISYTDDTTNVGPEIWVMKEYGNNESWTKLYSISKLPRCRRLLSFWKKDKLLLVSTDFRLVCYDLAKDEVYERGEHCEICDRRSTWEVQLVTGHESFVSLKRV